MVLIIMSVVTFVSNNQIRMVSNSMLFLSWKTIKSILINTNVFGFLCGNFLQLQLDVKTTCHQKQMFLMNLFVVNMFSQVLHDTIISQSFHHVFLLVRMGNINETQSQRFKKQKLKQEILITCRK
eukprot:TRINITY_DN2455_c0_g3_i1.p1 TRINITY_DN2455_c0_g3~~TRINITY_DN2455_c0_g3_i1.p1  ORF type:complete len:125 (-),score=0.24 TRINITY_DN2455_c0_g3_i1:125-499(-)